MNEFEAWQKNLDEWEEVDIARRLNQRLYDLPASLSYIF